MDASHIENRLLEEFDDLTIDIVIFEAKYPMLFTALNKKLEPFLFFRIETSSERIVWLASKTSYHILIQLLEDGLTLQDAFLLGNPLKHVVILNREGTIQHKSFSRHTFPAEYLPKSEFLDVEEDEFLQEIKVFKTRLSRQEGMHV